MAKQSVRVHNATRDVDLVTNGRLADNFWTRLRGLVGVKHLPNGDGLLIRPCKGVHCMFMSIIIDVICVDEAHRVVGLEEKMVPWSMGKIHKDGEYVIEVPAGTIAETETEVGDILEVWIT